MCTCTCYNAFDNKLKGVRPWLKGNNFLIIITFEKCCYIDSDF